jgi:hypothetical protein
LPFLAICYHATVIRNSFLPFDNVGNRQAKQSSEDQPRFNSPLREWGCRQGANPSTPRKISTSARADPFPSPPRHGRWVPRHPHDRSQDRIS